MAGRDLEGRVVVITGANIGIGLATATALARRGARLRLLGRSADKHAPVVQALQREAGHDDVRFVPLVLDRLASVRECAAAVLVTGEPIHLLINNAGLAGQRGQTADGFELHFGVNHLGHFLLTQLLLDRVVRSAPARVVAVASDSHLRVRGRTIDWEAVRGPTRTYAGLREYGVSKLANVMHMRELARRLGGTQVVTASLNPGRIASNIWTRMPPPFRQLFKATMWSTERGARSTLHCATASDVESGGYYDKHCRLRPPHRLALDDGLCAELWRRSEAWVQAA
jgi:retinol dehydrogenase-12